MHVMRYWPHLSKSGVLPRHLFLLTLLCGCTQPPNELQKQLYVFGTLVDITLYDVSEQRAAAALQEVDSEFQRMHREWHAWKPGRLMEINHAFAEGREIDAGPELAAMITESRQLSHSSQGLFNPAIGGLVRLWGFHTDDYPIIGPPPDSEAIRALTDARPSMDHIVVTGSMVSSRNPVVSLDFGGSAKGEAVDAALNIFAAHGIHNAIVNAGGDLKVSGRHGARAWRIAVRNPTNRDILAMLEVTDGEAVFTSGNYERYRADAEKRYPHIINPNSGYPVDHIASATVIHTNATLADAAATALVVAGPLRWREIAASMGVDQVLLVDAQGDLHISPAMEKRTMLVSVSADEGKPPTQ